MHFNSFIAIATGLLAASTSAAPFSPPKKLFTGAPFQLLDFLVTRVENANATLSFTIHDPDPLTNATVVCNGTWKYNSMGWPTGAYVPCTSNIAFAWRMSDFNSWTDFTLGVEHSFKDPRYAPIRLILPGGFYC
jgi:hypothetical protein